jgi:hypothetical protein
MSRARNLCPLIVAVSMHHWRGPRRSAPLPARSKQLETGQVIHVHPTPVRPPRRVRVPRARISRSRLTRDTLTASWRASRSPRRPPSTSATRSTSPATAVSDGHRRRSHRALARRTSCARSGSCRRRTAHPQLNQHLLAAERPVGDSALRSRLIARVRSSDRSAQRTVSINSSTVDSSVATGRAVDPRAGDIEPTVLPMARACARCGTGAHREMPWAGYSPEL